MARSTRLVEFLSWILIHTTVLDCRNANIIASGIAFTEGNSVTLSCLYTGFKNETSVIWYKGTSATGIDFILQPNSSVPGRCDVFIKNPSFDDSRVSHTCNSTGNIYTLDINPLRLEDSGTWSCTFQDPFINLNTSEIIIEVTAFTPTKEPSTTEPPITPPNSTCSENDCCDEKKCCTGINCLTTAEQIGIGVGCGGIVVILLVTLSVFIYQRKKKKRSKYDSHNMEPQQQKANNTQDHNSPDINQ